ncbi:MAG: tetratricopeptide repeat protein [Bacteroidia bacterium]|nr:tetratricopeptide repeat protein [Bacteroidia bacterium]
MLRKSWFYFLLVLFSFSKGSAHDQDKIDSLKIAYQTATHDTTKINTLLLWGEEIYLSYPDSALTLWKIAIDIANECLTNHSKFNEFEISCFQKRKAEALVNLGYIYVQQGNLQLHLKYSTEAALIFEVLLAEIAQKKKAEIPKASNSYGDGVDAATFSNKERLIKEGLASAYNNIGHIYNNQGEIEKSLGYYFLSLKIKEEVKDKKGMAYAYNNIGFIYSNQGEIEKALEFYFLSLKIREEIKDKYGMAHSYNNIGVIYCNQSKIEKGLEYYFLSLKICEEIKHKKGMADSYHNIGAVLCGQGRSDQGMKYLELGLGLYKELGYKAGVSFSLTSISGQQLTLGQVDDALKSGLEALSVAQEIGHVEYMKLAAEFLGDVYKKQGKFEDALDMYELKIEMRDSIVNEENTKATIKQQMKYEYEKEEIIKEQEEKEQLRLATEAQSRRDDLHYAGIFIGMFLLFGVVLMLGFVKVPPKGAEAIIFLSFLILFEFLLVLLDPFVDEYTGGAPIFKLILNAVLAGLIFPLHQFFEKRLKKKLVGGGKEKISKEVKALMFLGLVFINPLLFAQTSKRSGEYNQTIGFLKIEYQTAKHDTTKINALSNWASTIYLSNPDSALILMKISAKIGEKNLKQKTILNDELVKLFKKGLADAYNNIGYIYKDQGEIEMALEYYFLSLKIKEEIMIKWGWLPLITILAAFMMIKGRPRGVWNITF